MIFIVPFDFCNLASICRYFESKNKEYAFLYNDTNLNVSDDVIIIPGVGSFCEGMNSLFLLKLDCKIRNYVSSGGRLVGICLGMQLMFEASEESPGIKGLGLIRGNVKKLPSVKEKVPRIGWDSILIREESVSYFQLVSSLIQDKANELQADFYFVHSYYCEPSDKQIISGSFKHGKDQYCASIESGSLFGLQYHPEKSGSVGYKVLDSIFRL